MLREIREIAGKMRDMRVWGVAKSSAVITYTQLRASRILEGQRRGSRLCEG